MKYTFYSLTAAGLLLLSTHTAQPARARLAAPTQEAATWSVAAPAEAPSDRIGRYKTGDRLYVFAYSGLVLRDKPSPQGAKILTVPGGAVVNVIDPAPFKQAHTVQEACGLDIPGYWVKVSIDGKQGYIFDGYLLKVPPREQVPLDEYWSARAEVARSSEVAPTDEPGLINYDETTWDNGVQLINKGYEGGATHILRLPTSKFSLADAYLFATVQLGEIPKGHWTCAMTAEGIQCNSPEGYGQINLTRDDDYIVITEQWAD